MSTLDFDEFWPICPPKSATETNTVMSIPQPAESSSATLMSQNPQATVALLSLTIELPDLGFQINRLQQWSLLLGITMLRFVILWVLHSFPLLSGPTLCKYSACGCVLP